MHLLLFEVIFYSVIICSERTDFAVLFRVSFSAADELRPPGHFVGDRLIDPAVKFNFQPQPAVNFRVALTSIQSCKICFGNQVKNTFDRCSGNEIDIRIEPFSEAVVQKHRTAQCDRSGAAFCHP